MRSGNAKHIKIAVPEGVIPSKRNFVRLEYKNLVPRCDRSSIPSILSNKDAVYISNLVFHVGLVEFDANIMHYQCS